MLPELISVIIALIGFAALRKTVNRPTGTQAVKPSRKPVRLTPEQREQRAMKKRVRALEAKAQSQGLNRIERHELYSIYART